MSRRDQKRKGATRETLVEILAPRATKQEERATKQETRKLAASSTYGRMDGLGGSDSLIARVRRYGGVLELCVSNDDDLLMEPIMRWHGNELPADFDRWRIYVIAERVCAAEAERCGTDAARLRFTLTGYWQSGDAGFTRGNQSGVSFNVTAAAPREESAQHH